MAGERQTLNESEQEVFDEEWDSFISRQYPQRDMVDAFERHKSQIVEALKIAKYQLECDFGGVNAATNEIGWSPIQPTFILATDTPTYDVSTWKKNYATSDVTTMWKDWIGSSGSQRQLSKYATMVLLGVYDPVDVPKISAIKADIKSKEYPIWYVHEALSVGVHLYELPKPMVIEKEQPMHLRVKVCQAGDDELSLMGIYFAKGDHLRDESAYAKT